MSPDADARVFIVDDDEAVRDALGMVLRSAGYATETFASATDFLDRGGLQQQPGCLILDVRMPGMSGLELQDTLAEIGCPLTIVFLTGHGDVPMAVRAMKRGAFDVLQKPVDDHQLLATVEAALAFAAHSSSASAPQARPPRAESLSAREREVFDLMVAGQQTRAIAEALFISYKTVEFHRGRIFRKLGVTSLAELFSLCFAQTPARRHRR